MSFKPIDSRRDEFRKYLERSGVIDEFTKVLIKLYNTQERPDNAIQFIFENLGQTLLQKDQYEYLKKELEDSRHEIAELKTIIEKLQTGSKIEETVDRIEAFLDVKQEPVDTSDTSEPSNDDSVDEPISQSSEIQQNLQQENTTTLIESEAISEPLVTEKVIEKSENAPLSGKDCNNVESSEQKENTETENAKNSENISEEKKIIKVDVKQNEDVSSTSKIQISKANVSETSAKENVEAVKSTEPEESTNTEKPTEENKEIKADDAKK